MDKFNLFKNIIKFSEIENCERITYMVTHPTSNFTVKSKGCNYQSLHSTKTVSIIKETIFRIQIVYYYSVDTF